MVQLLCKFVALHWLLPALPVPVACLVKFLFVCVLSLSYTMLQFIVCAWVLPFLVPVRMEGEEMRHVEKLAFVNPQYVLPILPIAEDLWIKSLVLISMILQILLIFAGGLRYRCKSQLLTTIGWLAYMSADGVAMYAMGGIMDSSSTNTQMVYALWAPLLLIHLGGPDTITAYSMADNEIWNRHGVTMLYHVGVAAYVIYTSALEAAGKGDGERRLLAVAVLLFVVGSTKYAERTIALWLASDSQIVSFALPIHRFMQHEHLIPKEFNVDEDEWNYIVMGEEEFYNELWSKGVDFVWSRRTLRRLGVVTLQDVWEHEGRRETEAYKLCASFAVFKIYTRRFARLPFSEGEYVKTSRFFVARDNSNKETISKVRITKASRWDLKTGEKEMMFMYDYFFSKSRGTAYSKCGTGMRLINISLLAVACFVVFSTLQETAKNNLQHQSRGEQMVTYILMCVALGLELLQLCRILLSDWTMVWLICAYIRCLTRSEHTECHGAKLTKTVMSALGSIRKLVGDEDWQKQKEIQIQQLSVIDSCLTSSPFIWKFPEAFRIRDFLMDLYSKALVPCCVKASKHTEEDVTIRFFSTHENYKGFVNQHKLYEMMHSRMPSMKMKSMEVEILACHLATTICERFDKDDVESTNDEVLKKRFRVAGMVSKYMVYLLVACPHILPVHPHKAKMEYQKAYSQIIGLLTNEMKNASGKEFWKMMKEHKSASTVGTATNLTRQLLSKELADRWLILRRFWRLMFKYCGFYSKAAVHAQRLTVGGEFLTLKWVQWGHMGRGEQSDSALYDRNGEWKRVTELLSPL